MDVGLALKTSVVSRRFLSVVAGSLFVIGSASNSISTIRGSPYTSSADDVSRSSFGVVRIPSNVHGNSLTQRESVRRVLSDSFMCLWNLSTIPFACGGYAVVLLSLIPKVSAIFFQRQEVNCAPRSEEMGCQSETCYAVEYQCSSTKCSGSIYYGYRLLPPG